MKKLFFALLIGLLFIACDEDDGGPNTGTIELTFKATYDGEPLVMNRTYDFGGTPIKINTASYYLSDFMLENNSIRLGLAEIVKIEHTNDVTEALAEAGTTYLIEGVPASNYNQIAYGVGVSSDLNMLTPADFDPDHPLSGVADYWDAWDSYIFSKLEGRLDTAQNNSFDLTYIYHSGKDELYQEFEQMVNIQVRAGETTKVEFILDHFDLIHRGQDFLDIESKPTAHSAGDLEYPRYILENFEQAVDINVN